MSSHIAYCNIITCYKSWKYKHRLSKVVHDSVHHLERGKCNAKDERRRFLRTLHKSKPDIFKVKMSENYSWFLKWVTMTENFFLGVVQKCQTMTWPRWKNQTMNKNMKNVRIRKELKCLISTLQNLKIQKRSPIIWHFHIHFRTFFHSRNKFSNNHASIWNLVKVKITKKEKLRLKPKNFNEWMTSLKISKNSKFFSISEDQITKVLFVLKIWSFFVIEILSNFSIKKFWNIARKGEHGNGELIIYWEIWKNWKRIVLKKMEPFMILTCNKLCISDNEFKLRAKQIFKCNLG